MDNLNLMGNGNAVNNAANNNDVIEALKQTEKSTKTSLGTELNGIKALDIILPAGKYRTRFQNDPALQRLDINQDPIANAAIDNTEIVGEFCNSVGNSRQGFAIADEDQLNIYRNSLLEPADHIDNIFLDYAKSHPAELKPSGVEFLKLLTSHKLRRIAKTGYGTEAITYKSPLGETVLALAACIATKVEGGTLQKNIDKWGAKFPLYDYVKAGEQQSDVLTEYWTEKENNNGVLSPEREEFYRKKLYDSTIDVIIPFQKMMAAVEDERVNNQVKNDGVFDGANDPFHIHPASNRGLKTTAASLEAYKKGLELGWGIDDVAVLAAFRSVIEGFEANSLGDGNDKYDTYHRYQDGPHYFNETVKNYAQDLRQKYNEIIETPLSNAEDRNRKLQDMNALIQRGKRDNLFKEQGGAEIGQYKYFDKIYAQRAIRDQLIADNRLSANFNQIDPFKTSKITTHENRKRIDSILTQINARRTDKWWASESDLHTKLRESANNLRTKQMDYSVNVIEKQHNNNNNNRQQIAVAKNTFMEKGYQLLNALDEVNYYSSRYMSKRAKASTLGGLIRKEGAERIQAYTIDEKRALMDQAKKYGISVKNIDELRAKMTAHHINTSKMALNLLKNPPKNTDEKKKITNLCADIVLDRFIRKNNLHGEAIVQGRGFESLKKKLLKNSEFKKQMNDYLSQPNVTGSRMCEIATNNKDLLARIPSFDKEMKSIAKNIKPQKSVENNSPEARNMSPDPNAPKKVTHRNIM